MIQWNSSFLRIEINITSQYKQTFFFVLFPNAADLTLAL